MIKPTGKFPTVLAAAFVALVLFANPAAARTYIVNGLVSAVPFIGYGMNNLGKKVRGAKVFSYISAVEGNGLIKPNILKDIRARYRANPSEKVNLVGISYGANMVSEIASTLASEGIPVNYLATIEGTTMRSIKSNVSTADNFTCTSGDCSKRRARLAGGNNTTILSEFKFKDFHIDLGNNSKVHSRIVSQVR